MTIALIVTVFLAWVSYRLAGGDILLAIVFYPVVWIIVALLAIVVLPEDVAEDSLIVHYLMRIFE